VLVGVAPRAFDDVLVVGLRVQPLWFAPGGYARPFRPLMTFSMTDVFATVGVKTGWAAHQAWAAAASS